MAGNTGSPWYAPSSEDADKAAAYRESQSQIEAHIVRIEQSLKGNPDAYATFADAWAPLTGERHWEPSDRVPVDDEDQPK